MYSFLITGIITNRMLSIFLLPDESVNPLAVVAVSSGHMRDTAVGGECEVVLVAARTVAAGIAVAGYNLRHKVWM